MNINLIKMEEVTMGFDLEVGTVVKEVGGEIFYLVCRDYESKDNDIFLVDLKTGTSYAEMKPSTNTNMYVVVDDVELMVKEYR